MPLKQKLSDDLKDAMRSRDETRKATLRLLLAAIRNAEVPAAKYHTVTTGESLESIAARYEIALGELAAANHGITTYLDEEEILLIPESSRAPITDSEIIQVIMRQAEQRRESISEFTRANRSDLADKESSELAVLETYLSLKTSPDESQTLRTVSLRQKLVEDLQSAIRSGSEMRKVTLRAVLTAIQEQEVPSVKKHKVKGGDTWKSIAGDYGVNEAELASAYDLVPIDDLPVDEKTGRPLEVITVGLPPPEVGDAEVQAIIAKQAKQRRESIEEFSKANRKDLADIEAAELKILEEYLPAMMSRDEIVAEARAVISETGASGPSDKAKVMPVLMKRLAGRADGRAINEAVTELLAAG